VILLSQAWLVAGRLWPGMAHPSHWLGAVGLLIWAVLLLAYLCKWCVRRAAAWSELYDPLTSSLATLGPISTMLASLR